MFRTRFLWVPGGAAVVLALLATVLLGADKGKNPAADKAKSPGPDSAKTLSAIENLIQRDHHIPMARRAPNQAHAKGAKAAPGKKAAAATVTVSPGTLKHLQDYRQLAHALHGHGKKARTIPAINLSTGQPTGSNITVVGGQGVPTGFGNEFDWDRQDQSILLAVFVNAADPLGVSITNLKQGDQIKVTSASGLATFDKDKGNPTASGLIGVLAAGAEAVLGATGNAEFDPVVAAAEQFAQSEFKGSGQGTKPRDAFGHAVDTGGTALEEGGVVICLPQGQGITTAPTRTTPTFGLPSPAAMGLPEAFPRLLVPTPWVRRSASWVNKCRTRSLARKTARPTSWPGTSRSATTLAFTRSSCS
jgi:hypothetical protein